MNTGDVDLFTATILALDLQPAVDPNGRVAVLANLIALGQIGIEIVLTVKNGAERYLAVEGEGRADDMLDRLAVEDREGPREAEADRTAPRIGFAAKRILTPTEHLRAGQELSVTLHPNRDDILRHGAIVSWGVKKRAPEKFLTSI